MGAVALFILFWMAYETLVSQRRRSRLVEEENTHNQEAIMRLLPHDAAAFSADAIRLGDVDLADQYWADSGLGKWEQIRFQNETWEDD